MHFREKKCVTIPFFKSYYFSSEIYHRFTYKYSEGVKVFSLKPSLFKYLIFSYPNKDEQQKIVSFLELIDKKIFIIERKINNLKKYKKGIKNNTLKYIISNGKKTEFLSMFNEYKKNNNNNYSQYTVGKNGLIKINDINYDLSNHSVFLKHCLLIGIGIDEIAVSINDEGCVSPVYTVYSINNALDNYYFYWFLKDLLIKQKRFITKKSTRREFEIDKKELKKCKFPYIMDTFIKSSILILNTYESKIQNYEHQLISLKSIKSKILKDMFI